MNRRLKEFQYWPQIITLLMIALAFVSYRYFAWHDTRSNDAYVYAHTINIEPLVAGPISALYIKDNQAVKKGDKLLTIDPRPYDFVMKRAWANYKIAKMTLDEHKINAALASYHQAKYLYEHTTLLAPADGYVTNVALRVGQYVRVGEGLFALVETAKWWIITRYRETALRLIKPGDSAKITIDMYPGKVFHGHVTSIGWGINRVQAGNVIPSTLLYLEATENWIKIAQRFPVRIAIDDVSPDYPLRVGASATTVTWP